MSDGALHLVSLMAAVAGMFALAMDNDGHWRQLFSARPHATAVRRMARVIGAGLLVLSFLLCAMADPISMALLVWPMFVAVAAASVAAFLTLHARRARRAESARK